MKKIKGIMKGSFAKSVIMLTSGAVFAQAMNFLLSPVITRIYSPSDYGILTIYNATLAIFSLVGALTYELAIPIADDDDKAINVFFLCTMILSAITLAIAALLFFVGDQVLAFLNASTIADYKYFLPIGFFGLGFYMVLSSWAFRRKNFGLIAKTTYSQSIVGNAAKIGLGLLSFGPIGLLIGRIMAESAGVVTLIQSMIKKEKKLLGKMDLREAKWVAKRYRKFPLYSAPTVLLTSLSSQLPVILMSSLYGSRVVGLYGLALTVTFLPVTLIGKAVQDVFYGEAASLGKKNSFRIKELSDKLIKKMILLAALPIVVLWAFGPSLFSLVFGSEWFEAGVYSRLLAIYMFSHFIFHPISAVFIVFEEQKQTFILNTTKLLIVAVIFAATSFFSLSSYAMILIFSISMAGTELVKYLLAQRVIKRALME